MANYNNPYLSPSNDSNPYAYGNVVAYAGENERTTFLRKTYLHLLGAVLAFVGIEVALFKSGMAENLISTLFAGRWAFLFVIGGFLLVSYIANKWAYSATSIGMQYAGLGLFVVAESIIFLPILYIVQSLPNGQAMLGSAALITTVLFAGLTATMLLTKADVSWMGKGLMFGGFALFGIALVAGFMGTSLGVWYPVLGALLMCGYIMYETSAMMHHMRTDQHVAAALALFSSVATLFYYILRIVMATQSRD